VLRGLMVVDQCVSLIDRYFYSSTACVYNCELQEDPDNTGLKEGDAWPAKPQVRLRTLFEVTRICRILMGWRSCMQRRCV